MATEFPIVKWDETLYVVAEDEQDGTYGLRLQLIDHGPREGSLATEDDDEEYYRYVVKVTHEDGDEILDEQFEDLDDAKACHAETRQGYLDESDENRRSHRDQHVDNLEDAIDCWADDSPDTRLVRAIVRLIKRGRADEVLADLIKHQWLIEN